MKQRFISVFIYLYFSTVAVYAAAPPHHRPPIHVPHPHTHVVVHHVVVHPVATKTVHVVHHAQPGHPKRAAQVITTGVHAKSGAKPIKPLNPSPKMMSKLTQNVFNKIPNAKTLGAFDVLTLSKKNLTGHEAALVAAMAMQVNDEVKNPKKFRFNLQDLTKKLSDKNSNYYKAYVHTLAKINETNNLPASQKLYGPNGLTKNAHIIQGAENDCYLLSAINGLIKTPNGVNAIKNMIAQVPGKPNQFTVTFPGQSPETVHLTDTELGMYSRVDQGGQWLAVLSVAEAMHKNTNMLNPELTMKPGYQQQTLTLLTGTKYIMTKLPKQMEPGSIDRIANIINNSLQKGVPIGIDTGDHALTILGYKAGTNKQNGTVIIKNPWGTNGWYNPIQGTWSVNKPKAGTWYLMKGGVFTVPISELSKSFKDFTYATEENSKAKP